MGQPIRHTFLRYDVEMTKIKNILITGDDGYNSPGIRLVIAALKDKYNLHISATYDQQSGVGGMLSLKNGFTWGLAEVDGVPALWSKGTPCDAMELAYAYFDQAFDLIVSGVNWGANLGSSVSGSGTFNAAVRGLGLGLAPRAMAFSWDLPLEYYLGHQDLESIADFLQYPGKGVDGVLDLAFEQDFWGASLLNINFPKEYSDRVIITGVNKLITEIYDHSHDRLNGSQGGRFKYAGERINPSGKTAMETDLQAVAAGYIAITPCKLDYIDPQVFAQHKGQRYQLASGQ